MVAQQFEKSDHGMQGLFTALDTQIGNMGSAHNQVEGIRQDITSHFMSVVSARPFLAKIEEWQTTYNSVSNLAKEILEKLVGANRIIDSTDQDAGHEGGGWTPTSDLTFNTLNG